MKRSRRDDEKNIESTEDYYRRVLFFLCLDELINDFNDRILGQNAELTSAFGVFSPQCLFSEHDNTRMHLDTLARIYGCQPSPDINPSVLHTISPV